MQKLSFLFLIALLAAALVVPAAFAQDQTAQPAQAPAAQPDQSAQPAQAPGAPAAGAADVLKQTSFTGCLTGTEDNYLLRDENSGMLFRLHSDKDIDEHVGKKVTVTGKVEDQQREDQAQLEKGSQAAAGAQIPDHAINVQDIKDAGGSCEAKK